MPRPADAFRTGGFALGRSRVHPEKGESLPALLLRHWDTYDAELKATCSTWRRASAATGGCGDRLLTMRHVVSRE
jgi:hypothetical protein